MVELDGRAYLGGVKWGRFITERNTFLILECWMTTNYAIMSRDGSMLVMRCECAVRYYQISFLFARSEVMFESLASYYHSRTTLLGQTEFVERKP